MFWRKIDPNEKLKVLKFMRSHTTWSKEIDFSVDKVKAAFSGIDSTSNSQEIKKLVKDALLTIEKVKKDVTTEGIWPNLGDPKGSLLLMELRLQRESVFKHQIWRLQLIGRVADTPISEVEGSLLQEVMTANSEYENSVNQMAKIASNLIRRYKISIQEVSQLMT
ncbi:hypothetical protein M1N56_05380 [Dehalococcoidia bacterium]|nr:hypothetical protein [Dehalococcoidia bacterium]